MVRAKQILAAILLCFLSVLAYTPVAAATGQSSSTNYSVDEVNFGSGGELNACSTSYCSKQSAGEIVVGNTKSANYQAQGGFNTNREPLLEATVNGGTMNIGTLDSASTKSGSTTFSIRTYPAYGYNVYVAGYAPTNNTNGHVLTPIAAGDVSKIGTEQFGINLVHNTTPLVGADVQQLPDATFSFGLPASGYNTSNNFKFVNNSIIASSPKSSGQSVFTLSFIANITTNTPAGQYNGSLSLIAVPTF